MQLCESRIGHVVTVAGPGVFATPGQPVFTGTVNPRPNPGYSGLLARQLDPEQRQAHQQQNERQSRCDHEPRVTGLPE